MDIASLILVLLLYHVIYWIIEWIIDIPNVQTVDLPNSFQYVLSRSITSIVMNMNEWIDISSILADLLPVTYSCDYIDSIESSVTLIHLLDKTCNELDYITFNISRFNLLEELIIGSYSFYSVNEFLIDGLTELKSLVIGSNSFTKAPNSYGNDINRLFGISNCDELESIEIGRYSFSDYGGGFELNNLPKLSTIKIGKIGGANWSYNFFYSSFVVKGIIDMILIMNRSSEFTFHWIRLCCIPWFLINRDIKYCMIWMNE